MSRNSLLEVEHSLAKWLSVRLRTKWFWVRSHKTKDVYKHVADNVEKRSDKSNYAIERSVPVGKKKNVNGLKKDELD